MLQIINIGTTVDIDLESIDRDILAHCQTQKLVNLGRMTGQES